MRVDVYYENRNLIFEFCGLLSTELRSYKIYMHPMPSPCCNSEYYLGDGNGQTAKIPLNSPLTKMMFFTIQFSDGTCVLTGLRIIPVPGMFNLRDLGGYSGLGGKHVIWGKLFRSDHLCNMSDHEDPLFASMHIRSVIDFRGEHEWHKMPNPIVSTQIKEYHYIPEAPIAAFAGTMQGKQQEDHSGFNVDAVREKIKEDPDFAVNSMKRQQLDFVKVESCKNAFRDALKLTLQKDASPLLFHCRGGKDRTGYAAMLLLGCLGVSNEEILYDYLLTNRARCDKNKQYLERFRKASNNDEQVAQYMYALYDARKEYLGTAIAYIEEHYGTIIQYVENELSISSEQIDIMQSMYLE